MSTTTTTTTTTMAETASASEMPRKSTNPMRSTWRRDPSQWGISHKFLNFINVFHQDLDRPVPVFAKSAPIRLLTERSCHIYILLHAIWPIILQQMYNHFTGATLHPVAVLLLYTTAMQANAIHQVRLLRRLAYMVGFLDGDKPRDEVPDAAVGKAFAALQLTTTVRPIFTIFLSYSRASTAHSLSWWLPLELALYSVVLDFFFYTYHRACHELDALWRYHRTHHLTKHPSPLLSSFADTEQEILEIALIPLLTYATLKYACGMPMGFHDWWICHEYVLFSEALGHSGLRLYATTPGIHAPLLKYFGAELVIEDHDLHHRQGWKKSANYGKQTRVWDRLFGTCGERIEAREGNVDRVNTVDMPLW